MTDNDATQTRQDDATKQLRAMSGYPHTLRPELHKALEDAGIDYWVAQGLTFWNCEDGRECVAYGYQTNDGPKLAVKIVDFTSPAQVIAATLGTADTKPDIADMSANVREVKVTTKPNMWGFDDYFCGYCGRRLTSVANGLNEHFPVYCEDCGTKAVYE